ncbi:hypothetical protein BZA77DRAFT_296647 [Pyronema omphalodes]|nr:hypothetical protein BZA77DRAFT_296647 [Pyronema omphalodes]
MTIEFLQLLVLHCGLFSPTYLRRDAAVFQDFKNQISSSEEQVRVYAPINQDSPLFLNITRRDDYGGYVPPNPCTFVDRRRSQMHVKGENSPEGQRRSNKRYINDYETGVRDSLLYDPISKIIEVSSGLGGVVRTVGGPIRFQNGVIFPVNGVIKLPVSLSETLLEANASTFFNAIQNSGLMEKLDNYPKITVFAPLNPVGGDVNVGQQVIYDFVGYTPDLESGKTYKASCGSSLKIERKDGLIFVNGNKIVQSDGILKNGVIHYVDNKKPVIHPSVPTPSAPEAPNVIPSLPAVHATIAYETVNLTSITRSTSPTTHIEKPTYIPPPVVFPTLKPTVSAHQPCHGDSKKLCLPHSHGTLDTPHGAPPHPTPDVSYSSSHWPTTTPAMPYHPPSQSTSLYHIPSSTKPIVEVNHHPAHSTVGKPHPAVMQTSNSIPSSATQTPIQDTTVSSNPTEQNFELNEPKGSGNALTVPKALAMGVVLGSIVLGMW